MTAWVLPDHLADILPWQARHIEELRRQLLDIACSYGYELVIPPLLEHAQPLLMTNTTLNSLGDVSHNFFDSTLDLQTFKIIDQLSGKTLVLRSDTTTQVARIDAHLLGREGVTRLCYCGAVLHTRPSKPDASREPLQFGAELYGHAGVEADLEILQLALQSLEVANIDPIQIDLADARILKIILDEAPIEKLALTLEQVQQLHAALARKDASVVKNLLTPLPEKIAQDVLALLNLYGNAKVVLKEATKVLNCADKLKLVLEEMQWLVQHLESHHDHTISLDLADVGGYGYYSGMRFALYTQGASDALVRGGRYDNVGEIFGRKRSAVGFSLDLKELAQLCTPKPLKAAIRAPWLFEDMALQHEICSLRKLGETVVCTLPGHENEAQEFTCDRQLVKVANQWQIVPI